MKNIGKPCAGEPHARFDEGGLKQPQLVFHSSRMRQTDFKDAGCAVSSLLYPWLQRAAFSPSLQGIYEIKRLRAAGYGKNNPAVTGIMQKSNHVSLLFRLKKLRTSKTVLHVGAHPDDEEIGLLSYISFKHYGRAVYWSATRGESGQNIINNYTGYALGVYRTWESLNVREGDGGECLLGPFFDFGFSKTSDETFQKWGKENIVRELVRAIRLVRPQVIISRWAGEAADGHGHHQAVGLALQEAIEAARSTEKFPEFMSRGLYPWKAGKIFLSTNKNPYPRGELNDALENDGFLRINTGEYSTLLGCTYQEQAWMAYGRHQTQGMEVIPAPGVFYYYLKPVENGSDIPQHRADLFHGIETGLKGMFSGVIGAIPTEITAAIEEVDGFLDEAIKQYVPEEPTLSSQPLLEAVTLLKHIQSNIRKTEATGLVIQAAVQATRHKIREIEEAAALCLGLRLESSCTRAKATPGESVWIKSKLWNFSNTPIDKAVFSMNAPATWRIEPAYDAGDLSESSGFMEMCEAIIGDDAELSCPYWLKELNKGFIFSCPDEALSQQPLSAGPLTAECSVNLGTHEIRLFAPALHRKAFPGGYRELPHLVIPPISLHPEFDKKIFLVSPNGHTFTFQVTARCNDEERPANGRLELIGPEGWLISPSSTDITLPPVNGALTRSFQVTIPPGTLEGRYLLRFNINCRNRDYGVVLTPVRMGTPGLPNPNDPATCVREELILTPAQAEIFMEDARLKEGRYGYIEGAKEQMLSVLTSLGMNIHGIQDAEIAHGNLNSYDAIVAGPNSYLIRRTLAENSHRLLEYVEQGGVLIVQYHSYDFQGRGYAPYPFTYSRPHDRVTNENAPVAILAPENPLFHYPNKITPEDFENWVHDRGLYFFGQWDERYTSLLSCADAGESLKKGGLMYTEYGKGAYLYVGYSLSRQLPAGVSGAFRLFFNMLSLNSRPTEAV